ncbi:hypothetical protein MMC34_006733 [Xylographa carneopallida]|nr:hypothetical protein [Xylographa carneopallida]
MLSITDELGPPPAYSPHDPQTPTLDVSHQPDTPISPIRPSIRGGYLAVVDDPQETSYASAADYFDGRPFHNSSTIATILIEHKITPYTTRDDLPLQQLLPGYSYGMEARDVHSQDWATFVNYILTELNGSTSIGDQNSEKSISRAEFEERQKAIEAVVAEWNEGFFGPRRIRFVPEFSYSITDRPSSPTPSYRTFLTPQPVQETNSSGPLSAQLAFRSSLPTFLNHRQPQVLQPDVTTQSGDAPGRNRNRNPLDLFVNAGSRGFQWRGRASRGDGRGRHRRGMDEGDAHHGRRCERRGHRGRSESTSSSSSDEKHGRRRRGKWHRGRSSSTSSSSSDEHHGRSKGRRHRSSSTSSSSSSSSNDSVSSISSNELRGVEVADIRQAIANFRLDPTRKQHVKQAVRQLRLELRSHRRSISKQGVTQSRALKAETRTQKRFIKSEVKSLRKEAKQYKKGLKQQRRAEKRIIKAEKRAGRRGQGLNVPGLESYPTTMPRFVPGQLSGSCDAEAGPSLNDQGHATTKSEAGDLQRGLGTDPYSVDGSLRTSAYAFRPTTQVNGDTKWGDDKQDLAPGGGPVGLHYKQRAGVAPEPQIGITSGLRPNGLDVGEMPRRAVENTTQAENRKVPLAKDAEQRRKDLERSMRERARHAERREKDAELRIREAHKAAALRRKEQERLAAERERDAATRRGLERDAARRSRDQERAVADRERDAARQQKDFNRARDLAGQRRTSQTARPENLTDSGPSADASRGLFRGLDTTPSAAAPRPPGSGAFMSNLGASIEQWGTRFGRDAEEWGERFGGDMEAKFHRSETS